MIFVIKKSLTIFLLRFVKKFTILERNSLCSINKYLIKITSLTCSGQDFDIYMYFYFFLFSSLFIFFKLSARTGETRYDCKILELFSLHFNLIGWILLLKILKPKEKIYFKWVCRLSLKWNNNNNKNIAVMLTNRPNRPDPLKRLGMLWYISSTFTFTKRMFSL